MYYFSYNNYMDYTNNKKLENIKKINYLEEEKENYIRTDEILEKEQIKIKESLKNKSKILKFLNSYLKLSDPIEKNNLEDCSNVMYTGKEDWKENYDFSRYINYENNGIYLHYNLIKAKQFIKYLD